MDDLVNKVWEDVSDNKTWQDIPETMTWEDLKKPDNTKDGDK